MYIDPTGEIEVAQIGYIDHETEWLILPCFGFPINIVCDNHSTFQAELVEQSARPADRIARDNYAPDSEYDLSPAV